MKDIPFEEKKKFLESKLTEEEIGEVMRRYNEAIKNGGASPAKQTIKSDPVFQNVKESPIAEQRLQH